MNSKQRAALRAMAQKIEPVIHIGKDGVTENLIKQAEDVLEARELIKCSVGQNCELTAKEACETLCESTKAEGVSVLGRKFVLYRKAKEPKIII